MIGNTENTNLPTRAASASASAAVDAADRKLSIAVVEAVAETAGVDPIDLGASLYDCVDPDALDALFAPTYEGAERPGGTVTFEMGGYEVTADADGLVEVVEAPR